MDFGWREWLEVAGAALVVAALAWFADTRRMRRRDPDAVGWVPWRAVAFWSVMVAVLALSVTAKMLKAG
ncbi:MAG: hypothetical protein KGJ57_04050 [Sphingomonadales bacterium]|nr:hypothetical protein [Sphingomonadales bacterium]MDE2168585.1 hypothetical protein [Sphingomonadales bacterium]